MSYKAGINYFPEIPQMTDSMDEWWGENLEVVKGLLI